MSEPQNRPLSALHKHPDNPRLIKNKDFERLKQSLKDDPDYFPARPIILSNRTGKLVIIAGSQRYEASKALGYTEAPTYLMEGLTEQRERSIMLKDNLHAGTFDYDMLANVFTDFNLETDYGLVVAGLETKRELQEDSFSMAKTTDIKLGDMFQIGAHRLICGDSTQPDILNKLCGVKRVDLVFCDPPFNVSYQGVIGDRRRVIANGNNKGGRQWEQINNDEMSPEKFTEFLTSAFKNMYEASKPTAALYSFYASKNHIQFENALIAAGYEVKSQIIWNKGMILSHSDYHYAHEPLFYCQKKGQTRTWYGNRENKTVLLPRADLQKLTKAELLKIFMYLQDESTVWDISKYDGGNGVGINKYQHPNQKPVKLAATALCNNTRKGEIVLDTFAGSGSTFSAAIQLERICYGVEINPLFCQVALDRIFKLDPSLEITKL